MPVGKVLINQVITLDLVSASGSWDCYNTFIKPVLYRNLYHESENKLELNIKLKGNTESEKENSNSENVRSVCGLLNLRLE